MSYHLVSRASGLGAIDPSAYQWGAASQQGKCPGATPEWYPPNNRCYPECPDGQERGPDSAACVTPCPDNTYWSDTSKACVNTSTGATIPDCFPDDYDGYKDQCVPHVMTPAEVAAAGSGMQDVGPGKVAPGGRPPPIYGPTGGSALPMPGSKPAMTPTAKGALVVGGLLVVGLGIYFASR